MKYADSSIRDTVFLGKELVMIFKHSLYAKLFPPQYIIDVMIYVYQDASDRKPQYLYPIPERK